MDGTESRKGFFSLGKGKSLKKVAILQSNYIPWKGYFDLINSVDDFVIYDCVQYTKRDWRNRNQIKTPQGLQWLTVPVKVKGRYNQVIWQTEIDEDGGEWRRKHWRAFELCYGKAPFFDEVADLLKPIYIGAEVKNLSELNLILIKAICDFVGINTRIIDSRDLDLTDGKSERLLNICKQLGADIYVSGPAARNYIDELLFEMVGIDIVYFDYDGYPAYPQLWGGFEHNVSVVDVLFNCGKQALNFIKRN